MTDFTYVQDVKLFHDKFGLITPPNFVRLNDGLHKFRSGFFVEELTEYEEAVRDGDLATTLDSLIDLIYIIAGASLVHGIQHEELYAATMIVDEYFGDEAVLSQTLGADLSLSTIDLPDAAVAAEFVALMHEHIAAFDEIHSREDMPLAVRHEYVKYTLAAMFNSSLTAAGYCGCTDELWDELWADVQRANMSKERALREADSKRGSTYDVIKPAGWVPPQTEAIIARHKALETA
jgi:predicted HAD superfamily Cof-like phosphohydrolase